MSCTVNYANSYYVLNAYIKQSKLTTDIQCSYF